MSDHSGKTILLVEDDALIAMAQRRMLETAGYEVTVAHTGTRILAKKRVPIVFFPLTRIPRRVHSEELRRYSYTGIDSNGL